MMPTMRRVSELLAAVVLLTASPVFGQPGTATEGAPPGASESVPAMPPTRSPTLLVELAATLSGQTAGPKAGWRAAAIRPLIGWSNVLSAERTATIALELVGRFDRHGAPDEWGSPELFADSWGGGLRLTTLSRGPIAALGVYVEATAGRTSARDAGSSMTQRDAHWLASCGVIGGVKSVRVIADFGWMVTDVGGDRIGPIASLGLNIPID
jgi:hypothetical protein